MFRKGLAAIVVIGIMTLFTDQANAGLPFENLSISGAYLGLVNVFEVDDQPATEADHQQFDFAANIDFEWRLRENIEVILEIQGGTGGGSLGLAGPEGVITDLALEFYHSRPGLNTEVVIGSFDTPFGEQTEYLTNNANAFENPLFLNSLFYSAFGGTVGTLNTLGVMGIFETKPADLTLAVTNGGDETASNAGGGFEWVARIETEALLKPLRFGGSYMMGDDTFSSDPAKSDGFMADIKGWIADARYAFSEIAHIKGYFGEMSYGDNDPSTKDDVGIWMGEAAYGRGSWQVAFRLSGWEPDDDNGNGKGMSGVIPNPGLTNEWSERVDGPPMTCNGPCPATDQKIVRLQVGGSWRVYDNLVAKVEYVRDDADRKTGGRSTDVDGWMLLINGSF